MRLIVIWLTNNLAAAGSVGLWEVCGWEAERNE